MVSRSSEQIGRTDGMERESTVEKRRPIPTAFRVVDQSNRRWAYGFIRMAPAMMYVGGIALVVFILIVFPSYRVAGMILAPFVLVVPVLIDRSALLDPVDYINFSEHMMVKRLVKQRSHPPERIKQIKFAKPSGEDYDDQHTGRRCTEVTIRINGYWPAKLLVKHEDTRAISEWAALNGVQVKEQGDSA